MKALKALFLFLAMMYAGNSYAQTKEETIAWLKEKFANAHLFDFMEPAKQKVKIERSIYFSKEISYALSWISKINSKTSTK